jgi:hypothetical protein
MQKKTKKEHTPDDTLTLCLQYRWTPRLEDQIAVIEDFYGIPVQHVAARVFMLWLRERMTFPPLEAPGQ